jgi:copper homeostasis protein (lipoprotein)
MMRSRLLALALSGLATACATPGPAEPLLVGVFAGTLPCADCPGIATELTLVRKGPGWAEGRYLMRMTYLERSVDPLVQTGEWTTLRGDAADPDAVVYELDPDRPERARHFVKRGETAVQALDRELKPWPSSLPSTLARRTEALPGPSAVDCLRGGGLPGPGAGCAPAPPPGP